MPAPCILIVGTLDTKAEEIAFLCAQVERAGGRARVMDVGVGDRADHVPAITNTQVAQAAGVSLDAVRESGDENRAMVLMARGAALLARQAHAAHEIDGLLALGGTLGTDLALDVANALPLGCPKLLLSTIAHSHLIPPERVPADLTMCLWAGGLYGLNPLCQSALAQAAGAVVGACRAVAPAKVPVQRTAQVATAPQRPLVGMTSLGSSVLRYMRLLKPALAARGYELVVFHTTGMGGQAFESLAAQGHFVAVMDFSLQELVNELAGSCVTAGPRRLLGAGLGGVPQLVAPGATDMVDFPAWGLCPASLRGRPQHTHNRLIASVSIDASLRKAVARAIGERLAQARGRSCLLLPLQGVEEWDRPGAPFHDPEGLALLCDALPRHLPPATALHRVDAHINDRAFADAALAVFDAWVADGSIAPGVRP
jgi:uncharacterized protein (UPF0261 family)